MAVEILDIFSTKEAARFIKRSAQWLYKARKIKKKDYAPPYHIMGGKRVYLRSEILEWIERCKRG